MLAIIIPVLYLFSLVLSFILLAIAPVFMYMNFGFVPSFIVGFAFYPLLFTLLI